MTFYEKKIKEAQDADKIVYYDYLAYKRAAGWWTGLINDDWHRPQEIKRAKYHADFLQNLPNWYFLGFPIKELLKSCYSAGYCHSCAIALSLCFYDFEIITCNLKTYADHYSEKSNEKVNDFEHTFIVININDRKMVIDTTWGMITDFNTYNGIFKINKVRKITSSEIKKTKIYKFIEARKNIPGPSYESEIKDTEEYEKYRSELHEYMNMCKHYINIKNLHLQDFMNRCLFRTSNSTCLWNWRCSLEYKSILDFRIEYPKTDMLSIECDEFDMIIDSRCQDTKEINSRILENYHKDRENNSLKSSLKSSLKQKNKNIKF